MRDCSAIKSELDIVRAQYYAMIAPGVRAVRDSDGSSIEYTRGDLDGTRKRLFALEQRYAICTGCATGSYTYLF